MSDFAPTHKGRDVYRGSGVYTFNSICGNEDIANGESVANLWKDVTCKKCLEFVPTPKNTIRDLQFQLTLAQKKIEELEKCLSEIQNAKIGDIVVYNPHSEHTDAKFVVGLFHDLLKDKEDENKVLKAKLEAATSSLKVLSNTGDTMKLKYEPTWYETLAYETLVEINAITLESLKGE